jgi:5-methyltetrahydrofolate--homocysteine methyltransferase
MDLLKIISEEIQGGNAESVNDRVQQALDEGIGINLILDDALIAGMNEIGKKFRNHEIFLPDVLLAAKAMQAGMDILKPLMEQSSISGKGKAVIGTVKGDLHDIGKNLVGIMLKGAGYEVVDLGKDVSPEEFARVAMEENARVIGLSALLTTTMPMMKKTIDHLRSVDREGKIKVIIGGAPTTPEFARDIHADDYAYDAVSAVDRIEKLLSE